MMLTTGKAYQFFKHLCPEYVAAVTDIYFEYSLGRGKPDYTAFDVRGHDDGGDGEPLATTQQPMHCMTAIWILRE